jgi:hypothetical protein
MGPLYHAARGLAEALIKDIHFVGRSANSSSNPVQPSTDLIESFASFRNCLVSLSHSRSVTFRISDGHGKLQRVVIDAAIAPLHHHIDV